MLQLCSGLHLFEPVDQNISVVELARSEQFEQVVEVIVTKIERCGR